MNELVKKVDLIIDGEEYKNIDWSLTAGVLLSNVSTDFRNVYHEKEIRIESALNQAWESDDLTATVNKRGVCVTALIHN